MLAVCVRLTAYTCRCSCKPKRVSDPHGWVLGSKLGSSARTVCILNCWAIISPNHWPMVLESTVSLGPEGMVEFPATRTCGGDTSRTADLKQKFKTRPEASISFNNLPLFCHQVSPPRGSDAIESTQDARKQVLETLLCGGTPEPIRNGYQMQSCIYGFRAFIFLIIIVACGIFVWCVCVNIVAHVPWHMCGDQRATLWSHFSLYSLLRKDLVSTFTHTAWCWLARCGDCVLFLPPILPWKCWEGPRDWTQNPRLARQELLPLTHITSPRASSY